MSIVKHLWQSIAGVPLKYEYVNETIQFKEQTLKRIRALRQFTINIGNRKVVINPGDIGGFLVFNPYHPSDGEFHLSHRDNSWIGGNAKCCDLSKVTEDSLLTGNAILTDSVKISTSFVGGNAYIRNDAKIIDSYIFGEAKVSNAIILGSHIFDNAEIFGSVEVAGCCIYDNAKITGPYYFWGGQVRTIESTVILVRKARVCGDADIYMYPIQDTYLDYSLGAYQKKSIFGRRIESAETFAAAQRDGFMRDLEPHEYKIDSNSGYEEITQVFPLKRSLDIPINK